MKAILIALLVVVVADLIFDFIPASWDDDR